MELMLALLLFAGMIVSWLMMPGSTTQIAAQPEAPERATSTMSQPA